MVIGINGEWKEEACLRVDGGFLRGEGVFETMAARGGKIFFGRQHWLRMAAGLRKLGLPELAEEEFANLARGVLEANSFPAEARVRVRLTVSESNVLVTAEPVAGNDRSVRVLTSPYRRNENDPLAGIKATSYAGNSLALRRGRELGAEEVLLANSAGNWCEGSWSNVFAVESGKLLTPPLASGCLPGVTRGVVIAEARRAGVEVQELARPQEWLAGVEELFLTSSLRGVIPVASLDGRSLVESELTQNLAERFREAEEREEG